MSDSKLVDLEIRYTHLEFQVEELNSVVFEQQKVIDALVAQLRDLRSAVGSMGERQPNEKPPHY